MAGRSSFRVELVVLLVDRLHGEPRRIVADAERLNVVGRLRNRSVCVSVLD